ncbi:hypothetical protein GBO34_00750 [Roseivirga pacifica]|uniref:IPT/TIG domain-containing protein n=1 Tax=Roseivirga pacifica TaxID=1267423 RepID=UPI00209567B4|nr:IPT/TIG domain-containing protein [Roseivirga pacifica]MCO6367841.1 hypothetical protein [Roseivirga pacifica]MCO6377213.1 hypothetical protein [Roseivirga pacifica]
MTIQDIITEFGGHYINQGQNMARLYTLLHAKSTTDSLLATTPTDDTIWRAAKASIGSVLQPFQKGWTPQGTATMEPISIAQYRMKVDSEEYPDDLKTSWLGFLADGNLDRKTWPFIRWFVEVLLLPKAKEEYELDAVWGGKRKEPTAGTPGKTYEVLNGLALAKNQAVLDGKTTPIALGAWDTDDKVLVQQFEEFVDSFPEEYKGAQMLIGVNKTIERRYLRGYRALYGPNANYQDTNGVVDFSNCTIVGLPSMRNSDSIWATPKGNARKLMKETANKEQIRIEGVDRLVKMFTDWFSGVGFVLGELIFTNDQDLGKPVIDNISPLAAGTAGGTSITITGREFTGTTEVTLGGTACTNVVVVNDRKITCDTPAKAADSYTINIVNAFGNTDSTDEIVVS